MSAKVPDKKIAVVIIAYNAAKTIEAAWREIPKEWVDLIIIGDDCSQDNTAELARRLPGALVIRHEKNQHMGGNQMILYDKALEMGFDIVVLLHGDNQFDPGKVPEMVRALTEGGADAVLGSRIAGHQTREGGMPRYKEISNKVLAFVQNRAYRLNLSDYATGYKAYSRKVLETIPYRRNRRDFLFDEQVNTQIVKFGFRLTQVPIPTRYFPEATTVNFWTSLHYGFFTLWTVCQYLLHNWGLKKFTYLEPRDEKRAGG